MNKFIVHSQKTREFYNDICKNYPEVYFDWKIIALYYEVLQKIKGWLLEEGYNKKIRDHISLKSIIDPRNKIKDYSIYKVSYEFMYYLEGIETMSRVSRYDGFIDFIPNYLEKEHQKAIEINKYLIDYINSRL